MSRERCWQCQAASPGAPGSWGGKAMLALPPTVPALRYSPVLGTCCLWWHDQSTIPSPVVLEFLQDHDSAFPSLFPFAPLPFPYGSCGPAAAQASFRHFKLSILQPSSTPAHTGVSGQAAASSPWGVRPELCCQPCPLERHQHKHR